MHIFENVIFIVAMATTCHTVSSVDQNEGHPVQSKERRFLFGHRNLTSVQTFQHPVTQYNGGIFFNKPCNPAIQHCRLQCTLGYLEGTGGCQFCACKTTNTGVLLPTLAGKTTTSKGTTTLVTNKVLSTTVRIITTTRPSTKQASSNPPTSKPTTSGHVVSNGKFNDPCIPSQKTCDKNCGGNYIKGPGGCQYCLCGAKIPTELHTTTTAMSSVPQKTKNATIPHYLDLSPTSEACIMAKVICNQKCDHGFVSRPDDCLYCGCQKTEDVAEEEDTVGYLVTLPNPCVLNTSTCGLLCNSDYVIGPRDCQFCSCR